MKGMIHEAAQKPRKRSSGSRIRLAQMMADVLSGTETYEGRVGQCYGTLIGLRQKHGGAVLGRAIAMLREREGVGA